MQKGINILKESALGVSVLFVLAIGFLVYVISGAIGTAKLPEKTLLLPKIAASSTPISFDADSDGLLDWEEALWGTNPKLADSDHDGTPDGEEVRLKRDPKKAGPNDAFRETILDIRQPAHVLQPISQAEKPMDRTPDRAGPAPVSLPPLAAEVNPLHLFGNTLGKVIIDGGDNETDTALWNKVVGNTKMTAELLSGFADMAQKYETLSANIEKVETPESALTVKNNIQTAYTRYAESVLALSRTPEGSYLIGKDMTAYSDNTLALARAFVAVSDLLYREGIGFGPDEPGRVFIFPR